MNLEQSKIIILGMGVTGQSCASYLKSKGLLFATFDQKTDGILTDQILADYDLLIMSPGISLNQPVIRNAIKAGKRLTSDIELFVNETNVKLIGVTGSNGKTTVTNWTKKVLEKLNIKIAMGGNIGKPVLELVKKEFEIVILELSSFQLDLFKNIPLEIAVILNITPDHLDRYDNYQAYQQSKLSICDNANQCLVDSETNKLLKQKHNVFGKQGDFKLVQEKKTWQLISKIFKFKFDNHVLFSEIERLNALVVLSICALLGINPKSVEPLLKELKGLEHRNQFVANINGVRFVNDSKGTNIGASIAAIEAQNSPVILIAGGQAKGANFEDLQSVVYKHCKALVLIGQDAQEIAKTLTQVSSYLENSLENAVNKASQLATSGDTVLLSPACASFDMFKGYEDRGNQFIAQVERLQRLAA